MNIYLKWHISKTRSNDPSIQMADLNFYDEDGVLIPYPVNTVATANFSTYSGEGPNNIVDNNPYTKLCGVWNNNNGVDVIIQMLDDTTLVNAMKTYKYCTANDASGRDPISWQIYYSIDGTNWQQIAEETDVSITSSRYALTQAFDITIPFDKKYLIKDENDDLFDSTGTQIPTNVIESATFQDYGSDIPPDDTVLLTFVDPTVLLWYDSVEETPTLTATEIALPPVQIIITEDYDMTDPTILGIEDTDFIASNDVLFAISFDQGISWWGHNGNNWIILASDNSGNSATVFNSISIEDWALMAVTGHYRLRIVIPNETSYVQQLIVNYLN